jgi:hypothetical protein
MNEMSARIIAEIAPRPTPNEIIRQAEQTNALDKISRWAEGLIADMERFHRPLHHPDEASLLMVRRIIDRPKP